MGMDLGQLSAAPWVVHDAGRPNHTICRENADGTCWPMFEALGLPDTTNAEFVALARNAFDVMMRRQLIPRLVSIDGEYRWIVGYARTGGVPKEFMLGTRGHGDPFTALVEADRWYTEHVEKANAHQA